MTTPGPVTVLFDDPLAQVFAQAWPAGDQPPLWTWGYASRRWPGLLLEGVRVGLAYGLRPRRDTWFVAPLPQPARVERPAIDRVRLTWPANAHGLQLSLEMGRTQAGPLAWRLGVAHHGTRPVWLRRWTLAQVGPRQPLRRGVFGRVAGVVTRFGQRTHAPESEWPGALRLHETPGPLAFFVHAWASWGHSRVYFDHEAARQARFGADFLLPPRHDPAARRPRSRNHFYSDGFGILAHRGVRRGLWLGWAAQHHFFGGVEARLHRLHPHVHLLAWGDNTLLEPGDQVATDWALLWPFDLDDPQGLAPVAAAVREVLGLEPPRAVPPGWLSWYRYFREVTAAQIRANARAAAALRQRGLRLEVLQLDDGYAAVPGEWGQAPRADFPQDLASLAQDLRSLGFQPGVWQAPFIVPLAAAARHKGLLRWKGLRPAFAGWVWNAPTFGVDPSQPQARQRAVDMARDAARQGFTYLKVDFVYAAALPGRRADPKRSRAAALHQALRELVETFRAEAGPQARVLLCGVPLGSAVGLADAVRVGPDVDPHWQFPHPLPPVRRHPDVPGLGNAWRGVLHRVLLHGWAWQNDPDPLLPDAAGLTRAEKRAWATLVALTAGVWFVSADLTALAPEDLGDLLRVFPPLQGRPWVPDLWDASPPRLLRLDLDGPAGPWYLVAVLNWDAAPRTLQVGPADFRLPSAPAYWVRPFWDTAPPRRVSATEAWSQEVPSHGAAVWAVRAVHDAGPQWVGSDWHIGQGTEVQVWQPRPHGLEVRLSLPGPRQGQVWLALPRPPREVTLDHAPVPWQAEPHQAGLYRLTLRLRDAATLRLIWE